MVTQFKQINKIIQVQYIEGGPLVSLPHTGNVYVAKLYSENSDGGVLFILLLAHPQLLHAML